MLVTSRKEHYIERKLVDLNIVAPMWKESVGVDIRKYVRYYVRTGNALGRWRLRNEV